MNRDENDLLKHLERQSGWLKESLLWVMDNRVIADRGHSTALDVGCGPGFVMDLFSSRLRVAGLDIDPKMVEICTGRGLEAIEGDARKLPFDDGSFDIVYCTWLLLWADDPRRVISEMKRVSRSCVCCLAEPDLGARLSHPEGVRVLDSLVASGIRKDGGDPFIGRKLNMLFAENGLAPELGIHPGVWSIGRLRAESDGEWRWLEMTINESDKDRLYEVAKTEWKKALSEGTLFQFNPVFYAIAKK